MDGRLASLMLTCVLVQPVLAYDDDEPIPTAADMALWCKEMTYSHLAATADRVANWSHSIVTKGNSYVVSGHWRVNGDDVYVECLSRVGGPRRFATYRILAEGER